jgi:hypothetical protein
MGTIITVHGTFASGEEYGPEWWQRGSDLERDIRRFVEAEDGSLEFRPFVWDGKNSETSRRTAAAKLLSVYRAVQPKFYAVVAHSHGGSVADISVRKSANAGMDLAGLSACITVGTPYLTLIRRKWLVSRLGVTEQVIYLALTLCCAIALLITIATALGGLPVGHFYVLVVSALFATLLVAHICFAWLDRWRHLVDEQSTQSASERSFGRGS